MAEPEPDLSDDARTRIWLQRLLVAGGLGLVVLAFGLSFWAAWPGL